MVRGFGASPNVRHALHRESVSAVVGHHRCGTHATEGRSAHDSEADDRHRRDPRRGSRAHGVRHEPAGGHRRHAGGGSSCDTSKGTLVIGMVAPLSGGLSALGLGMSHSADLAVDQANQKCTVPGYELAFQAEDDQATPQVAGQAATKLASDPNVVGVVGTLNSSTSQTVQPILADRSIVQISPANTNPTLTLGEQATTAPKRPFASYFRVATTDLIQGPFARPVPGAEGRQEEHRRDRRRQDLRRRPGRAVRQGGREARRDDRRAGEGRREGHGLLGRDRQGPPVEPGRGLLRRGVPGGGPALGAARRRRPERPADGRRRHRGPAVRRARRPRG